jgi:tetratricopeptide (TPR) repeat protein
MSVQAVDLRHGSTALRLADAAAAASPQAGPRMRAFLAGQQAHAAAQVGERKKSLTHLNEAESAMEKAEARSKTFGSYNPSSLTYHIGQVRYELGDALGSITSLRESDRLRHSSFRRNRVRYLSLLAERQLETGHLEEACRTWGEAVEIYPHVQSGQCDRSIATMHSRIRPYLTNRHARELAERARAVTPTHLLPVQSRN